MHSSNFVFLFLTWRQTIGFLNFFSGRNEKFKKLTCDKREFLSCLVFDKICKEIIILKACALSY